MATAIDRVMAKAAAALLPGLLPTPPRSTMTTPPCIVILPADFPKPGRADSVQRRDAHKNVKIIEPCSPASSHGSSMSSSSSSDSPGHADSVERWDAHKKKELCSSGSPGRADSCERWGMSKKSPSSSGSSSSSRWESGPISDRAKRDGSKRPPSRASSADRWDAHKKHHRSTEAAGAGSRTDEQLEINQDQTEVDATSTVVIQTAARMTTDRPVFSGTSFIASPDPSVLPMPAFFASRGAGHASCASLLVAQ